MLCISFYGNKHKTNITHLLYIYTFILCIYYILFREYNGIISMYNNAKIMQKWNVKKAILIKITEMCLFNVIFNNEIHIIIL